VHLKIVHGARNVDESQLGPWSCCMSVAREGEKGVVRTKQLFRKKTTCCKDFAEYTRTIEERIR
jgi:hypothetical protein